MSKKGFKNAVLTLVIVTGVVSAAFIFSNMGRGESVLSPEEMAALFPVDMLNDVVTLKGHEVQASVFLTFYENSGEIRADLLYPQTIDWERTGAIDVVITLNRDRRSNRASAVLHILEPKPYLVVEAGEGNIDPRAFLIGGEGIGAGALLNVEFISDINALVEFIGRHSILLSLNGAVFSSEIRVVDTTPPTAVTVDLTVPFGGTVAPEDFVSDVFDRSLPVTIEFAAVRPPDTSVEGEQRVEISLRDSFGNQAIYTAALTVLPNTEPPRITGALDIVVMVGGSIMFRRDVTAEDAFGNPLEIEVDSSAVDVTTPGVYTAIYTAVDSAGLTTEVTIRVYVVEVDPEDVRARSREVLDGILREGMTQLEQARAIFDWIGANVRYAADFKQDNIYEGAHQALVHRRGDCFVFYSISEVLLTLAGIPNMGISRVGGRNNHHWNLVNPDEMGWHHFDATPSQVRTIDRFMFTQSQAREFTRIIYGQTGETNYFVYDPELYPEVVP
jgi:transglutaminase-like putative cysteine protease